MSTRSTISRIELEEGFCEPAPASRAASPEGERSETPASAPGGPQPPLPGLPGGGLLERPGLSDELIDELLAGARTAEEIAGPDGLLRQLTRRLLERALQAEMTAHLGYPAGQAPPGGAGNARNGQPAKTVLTDQGPVRVRAPRDRKATYEPRIIGKRQTRWVGFDDKVIALYARGLTVREIQAHLAEIYGTDVSPELISKITDAVLEDAKAWQTRPAGSRLPDRLPRRAGDQDPRRPGGQKPRLLPGDRRQPRRRARRARHLVSAHRRRQVLAAGPHRATHPWRPGRPDRVRRRLDRLSRGDRGRLPADLGADVHRAPRPIEPALRALQGPKARRRRPQEGLPRRRRRRRRRRARGVRRALGPALPHDQPQLARALGTNHPVPSLPARRAPSRLHDEHDRGTQPPDPQDHQDARTLPDRRRRAQADLAGDRPRPGQVAAQLQLEQRAGRRQDPLRRPPP